MPFTLKATVTGLEGVFASLRGVDDKVRRVILRKAMGEASKVVLAAAKANVPVATGLLRKSLGRRTKVYRGSGVVVVMIGPRTGFKEPLFDYQERAAGLRGRFGLKATKTLYRNPTHYAHLVEKGTRTAPPRPFLRPALDDNAERVRAVIAEAVQKGIRDAAK